MTDLPSNLPISTADVTVEVNVRMGKEGQSAIPTTTVMKKFDAMVKKHGDKPALHQKVLKAVSKAKDRGLPLSIVSLLI